MSINIYRNTTDKNTFVVSNELIQNKNLSAKAKGLYALILSLPKSSLTSKKKLREHCIEGTTSFNTAWKELEKYGYIYKKQVRVDGKFKELRYFLSDGLITREIFYKNRKLYQIENISFLYLLNAKNTSYYKIGTAQNVNARIKQLQTGNPLEIINIHNCKCYDCDLKEFELHSKYSDKRIKNEWFELTEQDVNDIKEYMEEIRI